jgi:metal-responsive CopG/Arc/MetJ family transcriptional regulator
MSPDSHAAFRLPSGLLGKIDSICNELDLTRSQFFRLSIRQYIKSHPHAREAEMAAKEDNGGTNS